MNIKRQVVVSLAFAFLVLGAVALRVPDYSVEERSYDGLKVLIEGNEARVLIFYAPALVTLGAEGAFGLDYTRSFWKDFEKEHGRIPTGDDILDYTQSISAKELYAKMKELGVTHFALTCRWDDPWNREEVGKLESEGKLLKIFQEGCAALYEVN